MNTWEIQFTWKSAHYKATISEKVHLIRLPDGTILEIVEWEEESPKFVEYRHDINFDEGEPKEPDVKATEV